MKTLSNLPIRWRLTLLYGGILSFILVIFASGVYYYRLTAGAFVATRAMTVLK